jgi:hypothetical protein
LGGECSNEAVAAVVIEGQAELCAFCRSGCFRFADRVAYESLHITPNSPTASGQCLFNAVYIAGKHVQESDDFKDGLVVLCPFRAFDLAQPLLK